MRIVSLFYFAANLFSIWPHERQSDFLFSLRIRSVAVSCVLYLLGNSTVHLRKNEIEQAKQCRSGFRKIVLTSQTPGRS